MQLLQRAHADVPRSSASTPCTQAVIPCTVVTHGIPAATAAVRISYPSSRGPELPGDPHGVLNTSATSPSWIRCTQSGCSGVPFR